MRHSIQKHNDVPLDSTKFLAGSDFALAQLGVAVDGLNGLRFIVARNASLDDIVVSLEGSLTLHLLRPTNFENEFKYLGPVAGVSFGHSCVEDYSPSTERTVLKEVVVDVPYDREEFTLI